MFVYVLFELQRSERMERRGRQRRLCVLRILAGAMLFPLLSGCAGQVQNMTDTANLLPRRAETAEANGADGSAVESANPIVAKARAMALGSSGEEKAQAQIDAATVAMRSTGATTYREEGAAAAPTSDSMSPEERLARLRSLSHHPDLDAGAGPDDRQLDMLARLRMLSHHPDSTFVSAAPDESLPTAGRSRPVSPDAVMRRMRELSGASETIPPSRGASPQAGAPGHVKEDVADPSTYGGLSPFFAAPAAAGRTNPIVRDGASSL
jgi:hypothetical protein